MANENECTKLFITRKSSPPTRWKVFLINEELNQERAVSANLTSLKFCTFDANTKPCNIQQ